MDFSCGGLPFPLFLSDAVLGRRCVFFSIATPCTEGKSCAVAIPAMAGILAYRVRVDRGLLKSVNISAIFAAGK